MTERNKQPYRLYIDIETYSSEPIENGVYKYTESPDFRILLLSYAFDNTPVRHIDLTQERLEDNPWLIPALRDPSITKIAHNAEFERVCFNATGIASPPEQWKCTAVLSAAAGFPRSLGDAAREMGIVNGKLEEGKDLIRLFCVPQKATKTKPGGQAHMHQHAEKREKFIEYCDRDVEVCRDIYTRLNGVYFRPDDWEEYHIDQRINGCGVLIDTKFCNSAVEKYEGVKVYTKELITERTGIVNPSSVAQVKSYLTPLLGYAPESLDKKAVEYLLSHTTDERVQWLLKARQSISGTAATKFTKAAAMASRKDDRARGMFVFCGAARSGRWSSKGIQLQNMARGFEDIDEIVSAREAVMTKSVQELVDTMDNPIKTIGDLVRSMLIASPGKVLAPCDFSAIEARVLAWLAGEQWRLDVFASHGKIYEASASSMFGIPLDEVSKADRQKGKVAELALGYGGGDGALVSMGAEAFGLDKPARAQIVRLWRKASPNIVRMWSKYERAAVAAIKSKTSVPVGSVTFSCKDGAMVITLPSGRNLVYQDVQLRVGKFDNVEISYMGVDQDTKRWGRIGTYGGKLTENITQAVARDLMAEALVRLERAGYRVVIHVHDEAVPEIDEQGAELEIRNIERIMAVAPSWAQGLPLKAEGYVTKFYKK